MSRLARLKNRKKGAAPLVPDGTDSEAVKEPVRQATPTPSTTPPKLPGGLQSASEALAGVSPLRRTGTDSRAVKRSSRPAGLDPYPQPFRYHKPPTGRCECCNRPAARWYVEESNPDWRYFHNGKEYSGPTPIKCCTLSCAKQVSTGRVYELAKSIAQEAE